MIFSEVVEPNKKKILVMLFYIYIFAILLTVVLTEPAKTLELSYGDLQFRPFQSLEEFRQPDDLLSGKYDLNEPDNKILCARDCAKYPERRLCYYKLKLEQYTAMGPACDGCPQNISACFAPQCVTADGVERSILTVNRQLPSPAMMTCLGDQLVFDVINSMPARSVAMHSHGMYQTGYPYMDGVPDLTQCPIDTGQTFRYNYTVDTCGTLFYHSHSALQMADGLQGPLIIRCRENDDYRTLYDYDLFSHVIMIQDWQHLPSDARYPSYNKQPPIGILPDSYIINGRGSYTGTDFKTDTPLTIFKVRQYGRYRFRTIGGPNFTPPCILSVEKHLLTLIAVDGQPIRPAKIGSLMLFAGERYDLVITASEKLGSYWMQVKGLDDATGMSQYAILQYLNSNGTDTGLPTTPSTNANVPFAKPIANDVTSGCNPSNTSVLCVDKLQTTSPVPNEMLKSEPDLRLFLSSAYHVYTYEDLFDTGTYHRFYLPNGGPSIGGELFTDMYNNISNTLPPFPLLSQDSPLPENIKCSGKCSSTFCECLHMYKIPLNKVVEFVITDVSMGTFYHPHHIHGYHARIIKQGSAEEAAKPDFYKGILKDNYNLYPLKDTVAVPSKGFVIMRIWASNPGFWLFHCHFVAHNYNGMSVVLQIGEKSDLPEPPAGFPQCGNFVPDITVDEKTEDVKSN